jgi:hypothetical protein
MAEYFILGIGGTGMRCIESVVHLCAMGMFDDTDIHLLALDTDSNNGNFARLKETIHNYNNVKGTDEKKRVALKDTFFSANIHYYEFSPDYQQNSNFQTVFNYNRTQRSNKEETDLADLVFSNDVEEFNLQHGYRAQTHLGSMMMYHSIVDAASAKDDTDLKRFLKQLTDSATHGNPRIFILGSVFGGTGASSIPIIPLALNKAAGELNNNAVNVIGSAYFGSTLLTSYFTFAQPKVNEKIIASSDKFALNSKVAMMYYDDDSTVKSTYQSFYMLGTNANAWDPTNGTSCTGGGDQKNDSHYIELMAACAAYDFYHADETNLAENKGQHKTDYLYRAIDESGKLKFNDFVSQDKAREFALKFGTLIAFSLFCNGDDNVVEGLRNGGYSEIKNFAEMDTNQIAALRDYFKLFHYSENGKGEIIDGWLRQLHRSAGGGDKFLFSANLFSKITHKDMMSLAWNKEIYDHSNDSVFRDYCYRTGVFSSKFDTFKKELIKKTLEGKFGGITNTGEQVYKVVYDTLNTLYCSNCSNN